MKSISDDEKRYGAGQEKGRYRESTPRCARLEQGWEMDWMVMSSANKDIEHLNNTTNDLDLISICRTSHSKK